MAAYVISEVELRDAAGFETYRTIAAKAIAQYGGRYLVRGRRPALPRACRCRLDLYHPSSTILPRDLPDSSSA